MTSPASAPTIVKPNTWSSSAPTTAFIQPCVSSVASVRRTCFIGRLATRVGMPFCFASPSDRPTTGEGRFGEHHVGYQPVAGPAVPAGHVVPDDPEVVDRDVGELGAARALADGPDAGRVRFEALVHPYEATRVERDPGQLQPDPGGVGDPAGGDEQVAPRDRFLAASGLHREGHRVAGQSCHLDRLGAGQDLHPLVGQQADGSPPPRRHPRGS